VPLTDQQKVRGGVLIDKKLMRDITIDLLHIRPNLTRKAETFCFGARLQPRFPDNYDHDSTPYFVA